MDENTLDVIRLNAGHFCTDYLGSLVLVVAGGYLLGIAAPVCWDERSNLCSH